MSEKKKAPFDLAIINEILGKPPLLKGEDRAMFNRLETALSEALRPETLIDGFYVRDTAKAIWELQLYEKMYKGFIDSNRLKAYENIVLQDEHFTEKQKAFIESLGGASLPEEMTERDVLRKIGSSLAARQAGAVVLAHEDIPLFERLIESRTKTKDKRVKEFERRRRMLEKALKKSAKGSS